MAGPVLLLIVGTDARRREALCALMQSEGYSVAVAASAADAADLIEAGLSPDAVIADLEETGRLPARAELGADGGTAIIFDSVNGVHAPPQRGRALLRRPLDGSRLMTLLDRLPPQADC